MGYKGAVFVILSTAAVMGSLGDSSEVKERPANYSCCGSLELKSKPRCESIWSVNNKTIAYSDDTIKKCIPPCRTIEDGLMTLVKCVDVDVIIKCDNHKGKTVEERIHYQSQMCPAQFSNRMAPGNECCVWLLLLLVIAGWIVSPLL